MKRKKLFRLMSVTSALRPRSSWRSRAMAAFIAPKPPPTITMSVRSGGFMPLSTPSINSSTWPGRASRTRLLSLPAPARNAGLRHL